MDFLQTSTVHLGWLHWLNYPQFTVINIHFVILVFRPVCQRLTSPVLHPPSLDMVTMNTSTYIHHPDSANVRRTELCVLASLWITFSLRPLKVSAETCIFARVRGEAKSATFFFARGQICDLKIFRFTPKTRAQTLTRSVERLADVIRSEWTRRKANQTGRAGDKVSGSTHAWCRVTLKRSTKTGFQTRFCPALRTPRFSRLSTQIITAADATRLTPPDPSTIQLSTWAGRRCVYWAPACPC